MVIFFPDGSTPTGYTSLVSQAFLLGLIVRKTQIFACEAVAVPQLIIQLQDVFAGRDVVWYIDNEAACSSLVRGASRQEDVGLLSGIAHLIMMLLHCRIWFEWVDSDSNPSDGLSRDGLCDEWTLRQGWDLYELPPLEWDALHAVSDDTLRFLDLSLIHI